MAWVANGDSGGTHVDDEKVEPAPGIGEVNLEAVGHPFEKHLNDEDVGKDLVCILQDGADHAPPLDVDVLEGLGAATSAWTVPLGDPQLPVPKT